WRGIMKPVSETTTYRIRPPATGPELICAAELDGALFCTVPCGQTPSHWHVHEGEWYCTGERCAVREVLIRAKHFEKPPKRPPSFSCTACGGPLKFHHYVKSIMLLPS